MHNFTTGLIFGLAGGLLIGGTALHAQCCGQLDVPLNQQIELEHYLMTRGDDTPTTPSHTNQDLWRSHPLNQPCPR